MSEDNERDYMLEAKDRQSREEEARRKFTLDQEWLAMERRCGYGD